MLCCLVAELIKMENKIIIKKKLTEHKNLISIEGEEKIDIDSISRYLIDLNDKDLLTIMVEEVNQ